MTEDIFKRKFSISKLNENPRKSVVVIDSKYEFNAPKYIDFTKDMERDNQIYNQ
jgi:hypothetical protein